MCPTAASERCQAAWTSRCRTARSSPSSARTARANPPRCSAIAGLVKADSRLHSPVTTQKLLGKPIRPDRLERASRSCRRAGACSPNLTVAGKPAASAHICARTSWRIDLDVEWIYRPVPAPEGAQLAARRDALRRRAADAGRGPRAHEPTRSCMMMDEPSLGLAPLVVQGIFDIIRDDQPAGRDGTAHRAEREHGAQARRPGLRHARPAPSPCSGTGAELAANEEVKAAYLGTAK